MIKKSNFYILIYLLFSLFVFIFLAYPSLNGEVNIQAYSDALTYERLAKENFSEYVSISFNLLGPILILKMFNYNYILIYLFNIMILLISIKLLFRYYDLKKNVFLFFLFLNPMTLFALFSVNKEILLLLEVVLLLIYLKEKSFILIIIMIAFGYIIKWQMAFFILIILVMIGLEKIYKNRLLYLGVLLFGISLILPLLTNTFSHLIEISNLDSDVVKGSGIFSILLSIQWHYGGYSIVFFPKVLQLLFGLLGRSYLILEWGDFWNNFVQTLSSLSFFMLAVYSVYKKKMRLSNTIFFVVMVFFMIYAITPIFSVRYFFPAYILLVVLVSQFNQKEIKK